ncbi:PREDICTED: OTU domain-containing protein 3 isoform X3 [Nelumbo nucifera]|uniref:OTU domain-containing protein 3 isoform X3 n=1 Tax=Nelumbo nucifera TaxID=4432 RepID=A0A1U8B352_NELNU|nr:PREDICTED: OTU domain-containing protein 3 isoform X3 [Nelumbo nucifera]
MVQAKHQKSKPKKQPHVKKQGKQSDLSEFCSQLDALGLKVVQVTADGNCFFRALADQLEGNEEEHGKYRHMVVQYILKHREEFEPFIEDDIPFDEYCQSMEKDGTWAGHMELQAASLVTRSNICIHQLMSPRWYIRNFDNRGIRMIHLSYHNEEHYNSVRLKDDECNGPAKPIVIKADAVLSATSHQVKPAAAKSKGGSFDNKTTTGSMKLVMAGSGCENVDRVEQVLEQLCGDVDAAIEFLIATQRMDGDSVENDQLSCGNGIANKGSLPFTKHNVLKGHGGSEQYEKVNENEICEKDKPSTDIKSVQNDTRSRQDDKKIPRNKVCPCGSKKKYKACCGSVASKSSAEVVISQKGASGTNRKERKQGKKCGSIKSAPSSECSEPPDVGALCI